MIRRSVLAALATGIAADDDEAARRALRGGDVVARVRARRRMERALIDAALALDAAGVARPAPAHVMRVAALATAGRPAEIADAEAVAAAYRALPAVAMPRFPLLTLLAALGLAAVVGGIGFWIATRPGPPPRTFARSYGAPSATAFTAGGVPLHDAALDPVFAESLTALVVAGGQARRDRAALAGPLAAARGHAAAFARHGKPLAAAWEDVLAAFAAAVDATAGEGEPAPRVVDALRLAARELTDQLAAAGLGYFVEGRFRGAFPYLQAYRVVQVVVLTAAGQPRRVLSLRRLDHVNTAYAALGTHNGEAGDPVLHLERIDENVATTVMPVLAADAPYPIAERAWLATPPGQPLAAAIGAVVRREYLAALGADADAAAAIGALVTERDAIVDDWRFRLDRKGIAFVRTENLFLPPDLLPALKTEVPVDQRRTVERSEEQMAALGAPRIHARVHDLVAASVRRHEAQHAFDYHRDAELRYPTALAEVLGAQHTETGDERPIVRSARAELAAYLSQVINDPVTPHAALWHLQRNVFSEYTMGTGEFYAGVVVLHGLARQLQLGDTGRMRRDDHAKLALALAAIPGPALREAAAKLWLELFGEPATPILDRAP